MRIAFLGNSCNFAYWFAKWGQELGYDTHAVVESDPTTPRDRPEWEDPTFNPASPPTWVHSFRMGSPLERLSRGVADSGLRALLSTFDGVTTISPGAAIAADAVSVRAVHHTIGLFARTSSWVGGLPLAVALNPRRIPTVIRFRQAMAGAPRILVSTEIERREVEKSPYRDKLLAVPVAYDVLSAGRHVRGEDEAAPEGRLTLMLPARQDWALKGNDTFLRAVASLTSLERNRVRLEVVDWGVDRERSRGLVADLGLAPITEFRPMMTKHEMWEAFARPGVVILDQVPPYQVYGGGLGGVARDALAVGAVVVTHAAPEVQALISRTAPPVLHVDPSVGSVTNALRECLQMEPLELAARGRSGREWLSEECDFRLVVPRYLAVHGVPTRPSRDVLQAGPICSV